MKFDRSLFRSKLARRIFLMFVVCALVPVLCLSILAFNHVTKQLSEQSRQQLRQIAKAQGLAVYERLLFLETELELLSSSLSPQADIKPGNAVNERVHGRFDGVTVFASGGRAFTLFGETVEFPGFSNEVLEHVRAGKPTVVNAGLSEGRLRIVMVKPLIPGIKIL